MNVVEKAIRYTNYSRYAIKPIGFGEDILNQRYTADVKTLMMSVLDNPVTIGRSANAVGKTHAAASIAVWFYKVFRPAQVYTAAAPPEKNLKLLLWGEIHKLIQANPDVFADDTIKDLEIRRGPDSFITGVTIPMSGTSAQREAKFSGKHSPHLLFILDEGDAIPDEVYSGIESCMSGGFARLLVLFNPRSESGAPYRMERDKKANVVTLSALTHPNVGKKETIIPGAVDFKTTARRIVEWTRPLAEDEARSDDCFKVPKIFRGYEPVNEANIKYPPMELGWRKAVEPSFDYMVLGKYPAKGSNQLISRDWIDRARVRWEQWVNERGEVPPSGTVPVLGLDVAEFGDDSNVACLRYGGWVPKMQTWSGVDILVTADRGVQIYKDNNVEIVQVDATGVGSGVGPAMRRKKCSVRDVKVASSPTEKSEHGEFNILRDQLCWACREWLRTDNTSMIPPDEKLIEELMTLTYEIKKGKIHVKSKDKIKKEIKRSPDRMDALCLTFNKRKKVFAS